MVSPHFPPINAADHQRVRMALPYLKEYGWSAHVLAVESTSIEGGVSDPCLMRTIPDHVPVTYVKALPVWLTRKIGLGSLGLRSLPYLLQAGDRLLQQQSFDLVFFSNTVFTSMALGLRWRSRFGIPYVLDFQDPWLNDYYERSGVSPPGGRFKYGFAQLQARVLEPKTVTQASHIITVSPAYPQTLQHRYPALKPHQLTVLPFGAPQNDFDLLPTLPIQQQIFDPNDGKRHWVYVGRGGEDMALALRSLFLAIQMDRQQNPDNWRSIQLHFVGTSYAPQAFAAKTVEPIAQACGIADLVKEHPDRIPYFEALQVLVQSDAILLIGSDDASYTASKLYPCILAQKPILAIFHQSSSVVDILRDCQAGQVITFHTQSPPQSLIHEVANELRLLLTRPKGWQPPTNWAAFQPHTAWQMTAQLCQIFDRSMIEFSALGA
ncbi:MAG: glycosyltransferase [Elainella sp. Prado103]|jgi:hypothetical protein|nr:glycosyltransferase [Elainella sp. Prado103]